MKLKKLVKKGVVLIIVYAFAMLGVLAMTEKVERMEEKEKLQNQYNVAIKIDE